MTDTDSESSIAETLRLIRVTSAQLLAQAARQGKQAAERFFGAPSAESPSALVVSSAVVSEGSNGEHDRIRIWNRGALSGELVVAPGDGARIAELLLMLEERDS